MSKSSIEAELAFQFRCEKIVEPVSEHRFHPTRKWRFDFSWPDLMLAVEVEGGVYANGRHTRGKGFEGDCRKYGAAMELGWTIYRCTTNMVKSGEAVSTIKKLIKLREENEKNKLVRP